MTCLLLLKIFNSESVFMNINSLIWGPKTQTTKTRFHDETIQSQGLFSSIGKNRGKQDESRLI